jgi:hypothetical protein
LLVDNDTAAAIGAKNGCGCASTSCAMYQARPAVTPVCSRLNHTPRTRFKPPMTAALPAKGRVSSEVLIPLAYRSASTRGNASGLAAPQLEQRNDPAGLRLIFGEARRHGSDFVKELLALRERQFVRRHVIRVGADLDVRLRVGP